jgi:hypothetical protein
MLRMLRTLCPAAAFIFCLAARPADAPPALADLVQKPYMELVETAATLDYPPKAVDDFHKKLDAGKKEDIAALEAQKKQLKSQQDDIHKRLDELNRSASKDDAKMAAERSELHCKFLKIQKDLAETQTERSISVPAGYDHRITKLLIASQWPTKKKEIDQAIANGTARFRHFGDVEDIGFRKLGEGQESDMKLGESAIAELRTYRMLPPECDSKVLQDLVQRIGDRIAVHSDLRVTLRVEVLDSEEINAFGLPGGRLLVNAGLISHTANEGELAGVMAHEIAHIAARHGEKLMRPTSSITKMLMQGATMAADEFTSGAVSQAENAAHGMLGWGVHLNLNLLGVNTSTEGEAGQLATQYLWHAGYDPRGFMYFYDRMVADPKHTRTASFFRTHPASIDRALLSLAELEYLPKKQLVQPNSLAFQRARTLADTWLKAHDHRRPEVQCAN